MRTDLVVVGSGVAGLFGALRAARVADVVVITKGRLHASNSYHAQGGVAAAIGADDEVVLHAADTITTGRGLCRPSAVEVLTREAPQRISDCVELGVEFDDGPALEGGHSRRRVVHAGGGQTGKRIAEALVARVRAEPRITVLEDEAVLDLWQAEGRCVGVVTERRVIGARATLIATGGFAALWARTTNPAGARGDGLLLAYRAGAALADLEFVQFHPTALVSDGFLLSEALRGDGALLLDKRFERPPLPLDFDDSRARERRDDPAGWRFAEDERAGVWRAIAERRDIRRFRTDPLPEPLLRRLLEAAHQAPSVGLMQPWRFILIRSEQTKAAMQALAARERLVQADHFDRRARQYLDLKIEGIREAPLSICVCCDRDSRGREVLGRHTIPDTDLYSTCLAIENLWLAARAEGVGVGWVSFYQPDDLSSLLGLPEHVVPVAWLCIGYPDERPSRPGLEAAGWDRRRRLDELVFSERWGELEAEQHTQTPALPTNSMSPVEQPDWWRRLAAEVSPGDAGAAVRVRDASDELVKPTGSLGGLEILIERWAMATGAPPPREPRAGILVFAADHGVSKRGVSLYPARVGAQVAAAAARGETAIGVLADALGAELIVVDVGLAGARLPALTDWRIADGTADITTGPALSTEQLRAAIEAGQALADDLAKRCDLIVLGEIGIGNTTVAAALLAALTSLTAEAVCGRGTGLDAQGLERKRDTVNAALEANMPNSADPLECLRRLGGLEFAALVGALLAAAAARRPILLDGFATGVAALVACRLQPALRDYLIAGHRSAEPAHNHVLTELGLEPLLDLRLRLGEGSGAALALPLIGLAARLHTEMRRFDEAGVDRASQYPARD